MFIRVFLLSAILIFFLSLSSNSQTRITIENTNYKQGEITSKLFGNFFEFLAGFMNGEFGLWAQELTNRGFDMEDFEGKGASYPWKVYNPMNNNNDRLHLLSGGYNTNGKYFQRISKNSNHSMFGISQNVYVYDTVGGDFYVYVKTESSNTKAYFLLCDTSNNEILFSRQIEGISDRWKKFKITTPPISNRNKVNLVICLAEPGTIDIDEVSFMPKNNVNGVRTEFYALFKEWQPGIIRYPGGWFADSKLCFLENAIGDIDKRKSPNLTNPYESQRMDFGLDEFMMFCDSINAQAHLVVNLENGTPEQAANWVEYCNSGINTKYGALRAANGHTEPYHVKYWEIGNEQWVDPLNMAKKYLKHYKAMKETDPAIKTMVDGNIWGGEEFLDAVVSVVNNNCDYYSYHSIYPALPKTDNYIDSDRFLSIMATSILPDFEVPQIMKWLNKWNNNEQWKLSLTELFLDFKLAWNARDTFEMTSTLETGLWMAGYLNGCIRNCKHLEIVEKTFGVGHIKSGYNSIGKRIFYPSPMHTVLSFYQNHRGKFSLPVTVKCDKYSTEDIPGLFARNNVPYLDAAAGIDNNTIYLSVLNRHPNDILAAEIKLPLVNSTYSTEVFELNAESTASANTPDKPNYIKYKTKKTAFNSIYKFPPHSHTIFVFKQMKFQHQIKTSLTEVNDFTIYPNPAVNYLGVRIPNSIADNKTLKIYGFLGELQRKIQIPTNTADFTVNISDLAKGIYFIQIIKGQKPVFSSSFIKL